MRFRDRQTGEEWADAEQVSREWVRLWNGLDHESTPFGNIEPLDDEARAWLSEHLLADAVLRGHVRRGE